MYQVVFVAFLVLEKNHIEKLSFFGQLEKCSSIFFLLDWDSRGKPALLSLCFSWLFGAGITPFLFDDNGTGPPPPRNIVSHAQLFFIPCTYRGTQVPSLRTGGRRGTLSMTRVDTNTWREGESEESGRRVSRKKGIELSHKYGSAVHLCKKTIMASSGATPSPSQRSSLHESQVPRETTKGDGDNKIALK